MIIEKYVFILHIILKVNLGSSFFCFFLEIFGFILKRIYLNYVENCVI